MVRIGRFLAKLGRKGGHKRGQKGCHPTRARGRNRGTKEPASIPQPPEGGLGVGELFVEQSYVSERGRRRKRLVRVDVDAVCRKLTLPNSAEREVWLAASALLLGNVDESTFEIWLSPIELLAVARDGSLVLTAPEATLGWVQKRFGRVISHCCEQSGRGVRFAWPQERVAIQHRREEAASGGVREQATRKARRGCLPRLRVAAAFASKRQRLPGDGCRRSDQRRPSASPRRDQLRRDGFDKPDRGSPGSSATLAEFGAVE